MIPMNILVQETLYYPFKPNQFANPANQYLENVFILMIKNDDIYERGKGLPSEPATIRH